MNIFKRKSKGIGVTTVILTLGIIAFTAAMVVPKLANRSSMSAQKSVQIEANKILTDAKQSVEIGVLKGFGNVAGQDFNSLRVTDVVSMLKQNNEYKDLTGELLTHNNPNITLGDLKVIANVPTKDVLVDSNGKLAKAPYVAQN